MKKGSIDFIFPINGDCINERDGRRFEDGVAFVASVRAPEGADVYINSKKAVFEDGVYRAEAVVCDYKNSMLAEDRTNNTECRIDVYYFPDAIGKYRLSSDDNILFLQDITKNQDVYKSIFDNPYLAVYKKAHDLYGARVHLNLFYEFKPEEAYFKDKSREYFNLSMMTDKFRDEFRANSDWLNLAFHSRSEFPEKPYRTASGETVANDCLLVCREIIRFAGREALNGTATVHWGEATRDGVRALRECGIRALTGYFERDKDGVPLVAYYTEGELCDHIGARDFFVDTEEDMVFGRIDLVINQKTLDWVKESLQKVVEDPQRSGFVSIMIHEQYFYPDYEFCRPDFEERVLYSCRYLHERGYRGAHIGEVTRGSI